MAVLMTPTLKLRGLYTVKQPFTVSPTTLYTCIGVSLFQALNYDGKDIYSSFYMPKGLTEADYKADLALGASIVVLAGDNGDLVYLPDTYILNYPNGNTAAFGTMIVSASLGPMSLNQDLTFVKSKVAEVLSDVLGLEPTVFIDLLADPGVMTQEQADAMEAARREQIKDRTTSYAALLTLQARYEIAQDQIEELQDLLDKQQAGN